jgi:hypothetical protein
VEQIIAALEKGMKTALELAMNDIFNGFLKQGAASR